jgi:2-polyprenyl-3-methyl-5-hydroxy-6-metoxy-1,4-benzoquinol methylase
MNHEVKLTRHGYYELAYKPSAEELMRYYAEKYYQQSIRVHKHIYPQEEISHRQLKLEQKYLKINQIRSSQKPATFLDIGAGEGFALQYFSQAGWDVTGLDYSSFGCETHHPQLSKHLIVGDLQEELHQLVNQKRQFDLLLMDNVLEHVLEPLAVLTSASSLLTKSGILIVEVPNDFSRLQMMLLESGKLPAPFWVAVPDHISYFNSSGLVALAKEANLVERAILADFPIDFFLANHHSNYVVDKSKGKASHLARIELDTLMHSVSVTDTLNFYEALGKLGMGRQITAYFQRDTLKDIS